MKYNKSLTDNNENDKDKISDVLTLSLHSKDVFCYLPGGIISLFWYVTKNTQS